MKKIFLVKRGEVFQYEEEYESTFSNGLPSLAEVSSSNMKSELSRLPKISPDRISVILSYWVFLKFKIIERGHKAGGVAYRGELYRHHTYYGDERGPHCFS